MEPVSVVRKMKGVRFTSRLVWLQDPLMKTIALLATAFLLTATVPTSAQERRERQVSWVNSELPAGRGLTHHVLASKSLGHDVGYVVWTPPEFDSSGKTKYGVIYFLHGMGGTEASDAGGFSSLVGRGIKQGKIPPVICVFPNGGRSGYRGEVEKMIVEELMPTIEQNYPTQADAKSRMLAGFSMGGAGSVRLSIMHPELFCGAGSWGGGMFRGSEELLQAAAQNAETLRANGYATLLINGDQDRPDAYAPLAEVFEKEKIPCQITVLKETPHRLGLYYERSSDEMVDFLGKQLKQSSK